MQLHQLLTRIESSKQTVNAVIKETAKVFKDGSLFRGMRKKYIPLEEEGLTYPNEEKILSYSVAEKLEYVKMSIANFIDDELSKEETNKNTKASLVIEGREIASLSAPALMNLENKLNSLKDMLLVIPTGDNNSTWNYDETENCYKSTPTSRFKTEKRQKPIELAPATDKHPAQVQLTTFDVRVGEWIDIYLSGEISSSQKQEVLHRFETMLTAIREARSIANQAKVEEVKVANDILSYIFKK